MVFLVFVSLVFLLFFHPVFCYSVFLLLVYFYDLALPVLLTCWRFINSDSRHFFCFFFLSFVFSLILYPLLISDVPLSLSLLFILLLFLLFLIFFLFFYIFYFFLVFQNPGLSSFYPSVSSFSSISFVYLFIYLSFSFLLSVPRSSSFPPNTFLSCSSPFSLSCFFFCM